MNRIFYSKVDVWYYLGIALMGAMMIYGFWVTDFRYALIGMVSTWWLIQSLTHMKYTITANNRLIIEVGRPFPPKQIALDDILEVRRPHGIFCSSSAALSHSTIEIVYRCPKGAKNYIRISPLKREEMIQVLKKRNPQIEIEM